MSVLKKRALSLALASAGVLGMADAAQAVSVNPRGLGEVLIYPYYTVRETGQGAAFNSLLSVGNATASAKAVKVRFLEGKNGRKVLDFNLYLSKFDVWTAAVVPTAAGAAIFTNDNSCTQPLVPRSVASAEPFRNSAYSGGEQDFAGESLDRTREGYIEIIEMGSIFDDNERNMAGGLAVTQGRVTHYNGAPKNCAALQTLSASKQTSMDTTTPTGGLFGSMTLVNPLAGLDIAYDPTALESFSKKPLWEEAGSDLPNLGSANPPVSMVQDGMKTYITDWSLHPREGANAVSAVLMQDIIFNEYVVKGTSAANTDYVVTMPTKSLYFGRADSAKKEVPVLELFQNNFSAQGACDEMGTALFDREQRMPEHPYDMGQEPPSDYLCWQVNTITFDAKSVLHSKNDYPISPEGNTEGWFAVIFSSGWKQDENASYFGIPHSLTNGHFSVPGNLAKNSTQIIDASHFPPTVGPSTEGNGIVLYTGLPVIGFAVQVFNNGALATSSGAVNANYAGRLNHKGTVDIEVW